MTAYYNENNPEAAAWLRELIKAGALLQAEIERELRAKDGEVKP